MRPLKIVVAHIDAPLRSVVLEAGSLGGMTIFERVAITTRRRVVLLGCTRSRR
jgi:hypothetical protein